MCMGVCPFGNLPFGSFVNDWMLIGPPGAGKSMLAARMPWLLPDLRPVDALGIM